MTLRLQMLRTSQLVNDTPPPCRPPICAAAASAGVPTSNVVITSCSVGGRRRLLQAGGTGITITLQIRKQGTKDSVTKAAEAVVDLINGGDLEKAFAAKGIDYKPKDAESNTKDPIK